MIEEIGGYLELEHFQGKEFYPDMIKLNLGRTAFLWLVRRLGCRRIFIPRYICDTVPAAVEQEEVQIIGYGLDDELNPVFDQGAPSGQEDCLYLVSFYGQLTREKIDRFSHEAFSVIVDNAQAFYDPPCSGVHTIYTCRKFFGLSDGAYVATELAEDPDLPQDHSHQRMQHILGRCELDAGTYYRRMLEVAEEFRDMEPMAMSNITRSLLRGIDYEFVREKRRSNYAVLQSLLPSDNPFTREMPEAPFAYPYYHPDGIRLRKALAEEKIFVPTNWSYLIDAYPPGTPEHDWSATILPLPVDQRYGPEEMHRIAEAVKMNTL